MIDWNFILGRLHGLRDKQIVEYAFMRGYIVNNKTKMFDIHVCQAEHELKMWIEKASKEYKGLKGKITCIEDYQKYGARWIINEVLITDLNCRFKEDEYLNILGYALMASYLTGKDVIKQAFGGSFLIGGYEEILNDIDKYNLRIV